MVPALLRTVSESPRVAFCGQPPSPTAVASSNSLPPQRRLWGSSGNGGCSCHPHGIGAVTERLPYPRCRQGRCRSECGDLMAAAAREAAAVPPGCPDGDGGLVPPSVAQATIGAAALRPPSGSRGLVGPAAVVAAVASSESLSLRRLRGSVGDGGRPCRLIAADGIVRSPRDRSIPAVTRVASRCRSECGDLADSSSQGGGCCPPCLLCSNGGPVFPLPQTTRRVPALHPGPQLSAGYDCPRRAVPLSLKVIARRCDGRLVRTRSGYRRVLVARSESVGGPGGGHGQGGGCSPSWPQHVLPPGRRSLLALGHLKTH